MNINKLKFINYIKNLVKNTDEYTKMYHKYDLDKNFIDLVPVKFEKMDVSATTNKGIITLNEKLLTQTNITEIVGYCLHELEHFAAQTTGHNALQGSEDGNYLDNPAEIEAFQIQLSFLNDHQSSGQTNQYLNQLLDHHQITDPAERLHKKKELLQKIRRT